MRRSNTNIDKYSMLMKQILAVHFSGCYITNKEFLQIAKNIGFDMDLTDRETLFKKILTKAVEEKKELELFHQISKLLKSRFDKYSKIAQDFPEAENIIKNWMQKLRSIDLLIKQRIRINPYE